LQTMPVRTVGSDRSPHNFVSTNLASQMQEAALADDVKDAVNVLKRKWPGLWKSICACASKQGARPIPFMVSLLEAQIEVEAA
jgi:hypothetical protein